jgi:Lar family restriction alleviation protein
MTNLKPCPFCGGEAELCYGPGLGTDSCRGYTLYASCNECGAKSPGLWQEKKPKPNDQSWKDAADDWNSRPGEEALKQLWSSNLDIINRELNKQYIEARAEIERLALELENKQYTITCASEENQQLKESLAEARAEIERQDTLLEKCLSLLKRQKEKEEL